MILFFFIIVTQNNIITRDDIVILKIFDYLCTQNLNIVFMPRKIFTPIQLPLEQPDRCDKCPLIGKIPKEERREGLREGYYCLCKFPYPRLKSKSIKLSAEEYKKKKRRLHRPCDYLWHALTSLPNRRFCVLTEAYVKYRIEYEKEQQLRYYPKFKFKDYE